MTTSLSRWQIGTTIAILVLSTVSTLLGLFRPGHYRDHPDFLTALYVQDLTILLVGVPVLALGLLLASRGSLRGYLVWLGALAYMTYMWASIAFSVAWNEFFLGYVVLFGLSLFALISGFAGIDEDQVYREIHGRVSPVVYPGFLWAIALGLALLWLGDLVPPLIEGTQPTIVDELGEQATVSHAIDLAVLVPALSIAGYWLWQRRPWGYVVGGVVLLLGTLLAPSITGMTVVLILEGEITVSVWGIVFTMLPLVIAAALAINYLLAFGGKKPPQSIDGIPATGEL
ncbi:hypothetical protein [Natronorubrum bangense]|uniref:Uncharacterized protein n=2 Tax=Natronorubrum bangense TaxID=61858 RepID=L9WC53_9EURY|nr:hypothetical protein [Natronorubrum bangense]ELY47019.1 hypothetical protein C494_14031 [Natronorubrum bangense JCM 10635]QCC56397.1 hypothetical protein DV706_17875 [Natronorubrum bangense]